MVDLSTIQLHDFSKHLNTDFTIHIEGHDSLKMELIEANDKSNEHIDGFTVAFLGKFHTVFSQKIYTLSHDEMGEISLFLVPFNKDEKGVYYEAVFSRLKK